MKTIKEQYLKAREVEEETKELSRRSHYDPAINEKRLQEYNAARREVNRLAYLLDELK